nr:2Fe-2S iron-sulfur cluster binding domain-containing protein [bacterium]
MKIRLTINGEERTLRIEPGEILLDTLRQHGYMGVKAGCRSGNCGTCTVLLDARPVPSCTVLSARADGGGGMTIEGLGGASSPQPIPSEFLQRSPAPRAYC